MNFHTVETAMREALRFADAAKALLAAEDAAQVEQDRLDAADARYYVAKPLNGSALSGAARRASLDLTRALAAMRRPS